MLNHSDIQTIRQFTNFCTNTQKNLFDFVFNADMDSQPLPIDHLSKFDSIYSVSCLNHNIDIYKESNGIYKMSRDGEELQWDSNLIPLLFHFYGLATMAKFIHNKQMEDEAEIEELADEQ